MYCIGFIAAYPIAIHKLRMLIWHKYRENPDEPVTMFVLIASLLLRAFERFSYQIIGATMGFPVFLGLAVYNFLRASIWSYVDVEGLEDETEDEGETHQVLPASGPSRPNPPSA